MPLAAPIVDAGFRIDGKGDHLLARQICGGGHHPGQIRQRWAATAEPHVEPLGHWTIAILEARAVEVGTGLANPFHRFFSLPFDTHRPWSRCHHSLTFSACKNTLS